MEEKCLRAVQDIHEDSVKVVRCAVGMMEWFRLEVGLHQESTLSPFLFAILIGRLADKIREQSSWNMMFTGNIVICGKTSKVVEVILERWRYSLEGRE